MMIKEIDEESGEHGGDAVEGDEGFGGGEVVEHPGVDGEEEEWGEWVSESAIGSGEEGLLEAEDDEAEDGEEGTGGEAEAGVGEDGFEAGGEDEEGGDEGLEEEGVGGELVAWGEVGEAAERGEIFAHGGEDSGADPGHGADGGDEADAEEGGDEAGAIFAEDVATGDEGDIDFAIESGEWGGVEEEGIEGEVEGEDDERAEEDGAGDVAFWVMDFVDDVGGGVPAGVGIHDVDEGDGEGGGGDERPVGEFGGEGDGLGGGGEEAGEDEGEDEGEIGPGPKVLESGPEAETAEMGEGDEPEEGEGSGGGVEVE